MADVLTGHLCYTVGEKSGGQKSRMDLTLDKGSKMEYNVGSYKTNF